MKTSSHPPKAVILAGGYGTRMFPLTLRTPKPLLPVAGKPVLSHILQLLAHSGIREAVISLKESQRKIERYYGNGASLGLSITYAYEADVGEEKKMGSVGALAHLFSTSVTPCDCLVIGADNFMYGLDLAQFHSSHKTAKAHASLALFDLNKPEDARHFGIAEVDGKGRIHRFVEKPKLSETASKLASTAVYHLEEAFIRQYLPNYVKAQTEKGKSADRIGDLWTHFVQELNLYGYPFQGIWGDIGNPASYLETNREAMSFLEKQGGHRIDKQAQIEAGVSIEGPVIIEKGCRIESGAHIGPNAYLMAGTVVSAGAKVDNCIAFERVHIGKNAVISQAILDGESQIGASARLTGAALIGYQAKVGKNAVVDGKRVYPSQSVPDGVQLKGDQLGDDSAWMKELESSCFWL